MRLIFKAKVKYMKQFIISYTGIVNPNISKRIGLPKRGILMNRTIVNESTNRIVNTWRYWFLVLIE